MKTTRAQTGASAASDEPARAWCVTIAHHPDPHYVGERLVVLDDASVFIGRGAAAFDDERISRKHAEVHADEDGALWIHDRQSRNGTTVNGAAIDKRELSVGDIIGIGKILFVVHRGVVARQPSNTSLVGVSDAFVDVLAQIDKVADRSTAVVFSGPSGVGKTALAQVLHERSGRAGTMHTLHCGAIADEVVHSELFGHTKGGFAGATAARMGLIEAAQGSTLLLDHVEAASRKLQLALLEFLDSGKVRRLGANEARTVDTRVVATSAEPLDDLVAAGTLPGDFVNRLRGWHIAVPPLSERVEDVGPLAIYFARRFAGDDAQLDPDFALHLLRRRWNGNLYELESAVEEAVVDSDDGPLISLPKRVDGDARVAPDIVIARTGEWFQLAGKKRVELAHRKNLVGIVAALVDQRDVRPNMPLSVRELMAAGWPGERPVEKSGANRVYVALTALRRLGLREVLQRDRDGYFMPSTARVDVAS